MSKCNYETYRYTRELCEVENQSLIECRFPGAEMATVLAVQARVVESECVCVDGEVKYNGKLLLGVVYEDVNKHICRAERGAEFFHKASNELITPACFAKGVFNAWHTSSRREGASAYVSVVVGARIQIYTQAEAEYLSGGEGVILKKEGQPFVQVSAVSGAIEETDDFEMRGVVDVLLHEEKAWVTACKARLGEIEIEGEICYDVCTLKEDGGVDRYEKILPVKMSLPCEEAQIGDGAKAALEVRNASVSVTIGEEEDKAEIAFSCSVHADCILYKKEWVEMATDAFCPTQKLALTYKNEVGRYLTEQKIEQTRVAGTAAVGFAEEGWSLYCVFLPTVELSKKGSTTEGVLEATALLKSTEGGYKVTTLSLPFALDLPLQKEEEASCVVTGLSVKNFGKDGAQVEGLLQTSVCVFEKVEATFVTQADEGEEIKEKDCAITIFVPKKGDGVWEVAKKMGVSPQEVEKCNPDVKFPIVEGERIVVYRQR